jgi:hypothetical protein
MCMTSHIYVIPQWALHHQKQRRKRSIDDISLRDKVRMKWEKSENVKNLNFFEVNDDFFIGF